MSFMGLLKKASGAASEAVSRTLGSTLVLSIPATLDHNDDTVVNEDDGLNMEDAFVAAGGDEAWRELEELEVSLPMGPSARVFNDEGLSIYEQSDAAVCTPQATIENTPVTTTSTTAPVIEEWASRGIATQSSEYDTIFPASNSIDGTNAFGHTKGDENAWWQVELPEGELVPP
jgi:hypothetical protein